MKYEIRQLVNKGVISDTTSVMNYTSQNAIKRDNLLDLVAVVLERDF